VQGESHQQSRPSTVVIVDDHAVLRDGLRALLAADPAFEVVGEAEDAAGALELVTARRPATVLLDLHVPGADPLDAIPEMRRLSPETGIVILTMDADPEFARRALHSGASGYVLKDSPWSEVLRALARAASGGTYVDPVIGARLAGREPPTAYADLTHREREVLLLLVRGHTNREIAKLLFISVRTAESHRGSIQRKLGASTRSELVAYAREQRLLDSKRTAG
jgi:two-component system response regulator NreC